MEDARSAILDLRPGGKEDGEPTKPEDRVAFFAVYDGHGGDRTAIFSGDNTHRLVAESDEFSQGRYALALQNGFLATDKAMLDQQSLGLDASGCTATAVIITRKEIVCGNAGDSRTLLGACGIAKPLSYDHKPDNEGEKSRICAAGGYVDMGRVNGNLALSRAIGDFNFKKNSQLPPEEQVVTALPDVIEHELLPTDEFIILACDGIWDCMSSQDAVEFVRRGIADRLPLEEICELLIDECLAPESDTSGIGCDNMTLYIVALLQGKSKEEWYDTVAERVANGIGPVAKRTVEEIRKDLAERAQNSADTENEEYASVEGQSPQSMLQQIFGNSSDGTLQINPEATTLLSRLGIRFQSVEECDNDGENEEIAQESRFQTIDDTVDDEEFRQIEDASDARTPKTD